MCTRFRSLALLVTIFASVMGLFATHTAFADTPTTGIIRVAPTGKNVDGCGSEAQPCSSIIYALDLASGKTSQPFGGAEIRVAAGTYKHRGGYEQYSVLHLSNGGSLKVIGGYSTDNWSVSNPTVNPTIIDGESKFRPILITSPDTTTACNVEVSGLTLANGLASHAIFEGSVGGGILVSNGCTATLSNLIIRNNRADATAAGSVTSQPFGLGGGIAILGAGTSDNCVTPTTATLTNVSVTSNAAQGATGVGNGGGVYVGCGKVTGTNLVVTGNTVQGGQGGDEVTGSGGGISFVRSPAFALSNIQVSQNTASSTQSGGEGGGLFIEFSSGTIDTAAIIGNKATGIYAVGGGIFTTDNGSFTLSNANIAQNSAVATRDYADGGGITLTNASKSTVPNALVGRNLFVTGNSLSSPSSSSGGGISCFNSTPTLNNITVANNSLSGAGDNFGVGMALINGCAGNVTNSIVSETGTRAPIFTNPNTGAITFNTVLINTTATSQFEDGANKITKTNPLRGDPAFVSATDFHLGDGSAAIDKAGANAERTDIDGEPRATPDVGADEFSSATDRGSAPIQPTPSTSSRTITLSWTPPAGRVVQQYLISYEPVAPAVSAVTAPQVITVPIGQTSYVITGLSTGGTYNVTITALGVTGAQVGTSGTFQVEVVVPPLTFTYLPLATR